MKLFIFSWAFSIVWICFCPFSVSLYVLFLSSHIPSIRSFLSSEYRSE